MMKYKVLFLLTAITLMSFNANAQRGVRIGYIDTEYILQNVPEYEEASSLLDKKVLKWKSEVEKRLSEIEQKKQELNNEKVLLTKELYDERAEVLSFEEAEIIDYQQNRFGPNGDLMIQKRKLIEPVQDQIFAAVQEIAELKKFDFVFDKSADVIMLYAAERYDISEQVLRTITRTSKRKQTKNKKERKALEDEEVVPVVDKEKEERQKALDDKKAAREVQLADRRAQREKAAKERKQQQQEAREAKKREAAERRQKVKDAKNKQSKPKETTAVKKDSVAQTSNVKTETKKTVKKDATPSKKPKTTAELIEEKRQKKLKDREARKKVLEDRKKKTREAREKQLKKKDSIAKARASKNKENN